MAGDVHAGDLLFYGQLLPGGEVRQAGQFAGLLDHGGFAEGHVEQAQLAAHGLLKLLLRLIDHRLVYSHQGLAAVTEAVKSSCLYHILDRTLIDIQSRRTFDEIVQILIKAVRLPLIHDQPDDCTPHAFYRSERV